MKMARVWGLPSLLFDLNLLEIRISYSLLMVENGSTIEQPLIHQDNTNYKL